jgi:AcrR family transcriptional regulator
MPEKPKRSMIRNVAAKLFVDKGFENTSIKDLAAAAGISTSVIYYYFDSKEELLYQIVDETLNAGLELISEVEKSEKSPKEKLTSVLDIHTRSYADDIHKVILMVRDHKSLSEEHRAALDIRILEGLKTSGEMLHLNSTVCAYAFFGMVSWIYRWYNPKGKIKPKELSEIFKQIFTKGIYSERS